MKLIRKVLMRQGFSTKFRPIFSQYIVSYLFVIQIVCLAAVVEAYVSTFFMKNIIIILNKSVS